MRIRKNAKVSPVLLTLSQSRGSASAAELLQTHVCQLNQSPWDVIPFDSVPIQFECNELSFTNCNNGSNSDSIGAVDISVPLMMMEKPKMEDMETVCCEEELCKKEAKDECQSSNLDSYNKKVTNAMVRRGKSCVKKHRQPPPSSSPYDFYYYSGFGPQWGKRRGDRSSSSNGELNKNNNINISSAIVESENNAEDNNINSENVVSAGLFEVEVETVDEFDFVDDDGDDDDYDDNEDDSGKKRMRKPVKARSLKSLM